MNKHHPVPRERALVLGGGGSTGNAWLLGVVAGLVAEGIDVTDADLTVGTSAGATAAAQIAGASPEALYRSAVAEESAPAAVAERPDAARGPIAADHLARLRARVAESADLVAYRRRVSDDALALRASNDPHAQASRRQVVAARLPVHEWPDRALWLTALDARAAEPVVFDATSGVSLVDAVAASCAGGFAHLIDGHPYLDGGYRANAENADLASGYRRVLVLSPLGGNSLHPPQWGTHLAAQVDALRAAGSRVEVLVPDVDSEHLFGANAMDASKRPAAALAGYELGQARASSVRDLWGGTAGELRALIEDVPLGWSSVTIDGRRWGVTRSRQSRGRVDSIKAERLDDGDLVSANVWATSGGDVLKPCEMPAAKVLWFLRESAAARAATPE